MERSGYIPFRYRPPWTDNLTRFSKAGSNAVAAPHQRWAKLAHSGRHIDVV
jgi:hypothetical protein